MPDTAPLAAYNPDASAAPPDLVARNFVAVDIVDNCNLRCPFCLFDYSGTKSTHFMTTEVFDAALRLLPLVPDGGFWLSCLHEPSLHPDFLALIERVPREHRRKLMFTTNIAKRANESYFQALAASGACFINISIESRTPALYEKFRKGARFSIFQENWDRLIAAWRAAASPPHLRYVIMAYRSNLAEIPDLVRYLRAERLAWHVEVRCTFEKPHITAEFRAAEFLESADWTWLAQQLSPYTSHEVSLWTPETAEKAEPAESTDIGALLPAPAAARAFALPPALPWRTPPALPGDDAGPAAFPLNMQMRWDGQFVLLGPTSGFLDELGTNFAVGWIRDDRDLDRRLGFEVVWRGPDGPVLVGEGRADLDYAPLRGADGAAMNFGFRFDFARDYAPAELEALEIWPCGAAQPLPRAPGFDGFVTVRSLTHVEGWIRNRFNPYARVDYEVFLALPGRVEALGTGIADIVAERHLYTRRRETPHAFELPFPRRLSPEERDHVVVRVIGEARVIRLSRQLVTM
jgi:hypothetical protein